MKILKSNESTETILNGYIPIMRRCVYFKSLKRPGKHNYIVHTWRCTKKRFSIIVGLFLELQFL